MAARWIRENSHAKPPEGSDAAQAMIDGFAASLVFDDAAITQTLRGLWTDSYLAGAQDAAAQLPAPRVGQALSQAVASIDWGTWRPGSSRVASLLDGTGFEDLLNQTGIVIRGLESTNRDLIGRAIRDGVARGESVQTIAREIERILHDPKRAYLIAVTEVNRAMTEGSIRSYREHDVEMYDLITALNPCPRCAQLAADNPHPLDDSDAQSPIHPRCRCAVAPHIEWSQS